MSSNPLVKPNLFTRSLHPENQETPISFIHSESLSNKLFFRIKSHWIWILLIQVCIKSKGLPGQGRAILPK
jgi:hypothetical protein